MKSECSTFLRSKGKVIAVTLSDDEVFDHESESNQEGNFMAFTATAIVSEIETVDENPSNETIHDYYLVPLMWVGPKLIIPDNEYTSLEMVSMALEMVPTSKRLLGNDIP